MSPTDARVARSWRPPPRIDSPVARRLLLAGIAVYAGIALLTVDVDLARIAEGLARAGEFFGGLVRPDFTTRWTDIRGGLVESLAMTLAATVVGLLLSIPVGLGAARNLVPAPVYGVCRAILALFRAFHEIILAILFVAMFGFGPFAGVTTLVVATVGFLGKLLAEAVEEMDPRPVEALTTAGATWPSRVVFGVLPQVMPRVLGLALYRLDINFRESAIIGLVGAGGIGATLTTAFSRYEFESVSAILILIIVLVFAAEVISSRLRRSLL
ncbi:MAG: phosphonate ABC transporter, permease protein PhnE [Longimicrobiales bacterium]|nr:phosphonate ABC transporter, permease protein PhnE [Longimicrobiales bacterium]